MSRRPIFSVFIVAAFSAYICQPVDMATSEVQPRATNSQALVVFSNANPYSAGFSLPVRPFVIGDEKLNSILHQYFLNLHDAGGRPFTLRQAWDARTDSDLEPTGMKWTGAAVWDAAIVLAEYLHKNAALIQDRRAVEIGAGLGLLSVAAGAFGARSVCATDFDEHVLKLAKANLESNLPELSASGLATTAPLRWGKSSTEQLAAVAPPFDIVLGSDIVYREELFKDLIETLVAVTAEDGLLFLAHKPRGLAEEKFFFWLSKHFRVLKIVDAAEVLPELAPTGVQVRLCRRIRAFD